MKQRLSTKKAAELLGLPKQILIVTIKCTKLFEFT